MNSLFNNFVEIVVEKQKSGKELSFRPNMLEEVQKGAEAEMMLENLIKSFDVPSRVFTPEHRPV